MPISGQAAAQAGVAKAKEVGVDLKKRVLDVAYSSAMGRMPKVPRFDAGASSRDPHPLSENKETPK